MGVDFLKPNQYLAVAFQEGPVFFRITAVEKVRYEDYEVGKVAAGQQTDPFTPYIEGYNQRLLEPAQAITIYQAFIGVAPEEMELYLKFPGQTGRYDLAGYIVPGKTKWIDGSISPAEEPAEESELITFRDLYPMFVARNPASWDVYGVLNFWINKMHYEIITDIELLQKLATGRKACKVYTFLQPFQAPNWLKSLQIPALNVSTSMQIRTVADLMKYNAQLWAEGGTRPGP